MLAVYYITPRKLRNAFLLIVNLVFYGWGEPVFVLIMIASTVTNYICGLLIQRYKSIRPGLSKFYLVLSVVLSLGFLGFFKYAGFVAELVQQIPWFSAITVPIIPLPIGISFYTFQTMSYSIDVYRADTRAQPNIVTFGTYVSLFPQLIAGPIVRYRDVEDQLMYRRESLPQFAAGIRLFLVGLGKKVLIANQMGALWDSILTTNGSNGWLGSWVGIAAYALQIYFDFSGYSDMACGLGRMLGFEFLKNFDYPYISKSITEFWRRWHISLSTWFRDYVYIPLGGNRKGKLRQVFNLFVVWGLTGLWHGANVNFVLWGLYYFVLLVVEKFVLKELLKKLPAALCHLYAMLLVLLGWVLFYFTDLSAMLNFLGQLFSGQAGVIGSHALTATLQYLPLTLVAIFACTPLGKRIYDWAMDKKAGRPLELTACLLVLLLSTAALVSQSYNPFLYFQF